MARVRVAVTLDASRTEVWRDVSRLERHVEWMADAESITFLTRRRRGRGTAFDCVTRVGPLRLTDRMVVTSWRPRRSIGIRHQGVVTGEGRFVLRPAPGGRTRFEWTERLSFPWWMGGALGAWVAAPVLAWIWRRNLRRLASRFGSPGPRGESLS